MQIIKYRLDDTNGRKNVNILIYLASQILGQLKKNSFLFLHYLNWFTQILQILQVGLGWLGYYTKISR